MTLKICVARSPAEIEHLRPLWEDLQYHTNADIDFFLLVCRQLASVQGPYVLHLVDDHGSNALIIGRLERRTIPVRIGYKVLFNLHAVCLSVVRGGILGEVDSEASRSVVGFLRQQMRRGVFDAVYFSGLPCRSPLYETALTSPPRLCRDLFHRRAPLRTASLPEGGASLLARLQKKNVKKLHRYWKALAQDHDGPVSLLAVSEPSQVDRLCADAETIARLTYHRGIGVGFADTADLRARLKLRALRGQLHGYLLLVKDKPCAFWIGTRIGTVFFSEYTGYDPAFAKYDCGTYLLVRMADDLRQRHGVVQIDFGAGDALYKQRFGDAFSMEADLFIYSLTPKGLMLSLGRQSQILGERLASQILRRFGVFDKIKKQWRLKKQAMVAGRQR